MTALALAIAADHPSFQGHFPGTPVVPGVVLLDEVIRALEVAAGGEPRTWQIAAVKFLRAIRPGEPLALEHERLVGGTIRFVIRSCGQAVASGTLSPT
jgi:3-hydroxymyristoyl/3-hydroxydecanoyl-(acyl carrier protein) dehydratase